MDFSQVKAITIPEGSVNRILSGTTVLWKKVSTRLPGEYQEVEYLESTGTQYIDTNLLYAVNDRIEVDVAPVVITQDRAVFGSYISSAYVELGILTSKFRFDISSTATTPISANVRYKVVKDGATWTVDGNTITTSGSNKDTTYPIYLFGRCFNGTAQKMSNIKVYSYKHIRNNVTIADYIPCYRKSDGVAGMYDVVNDVFYTNAGSGSFTVGPDIIAIPSEYQKVEYIQSSGTQYIDTGVKVSTNNKITMDVQFDDASYMQLNGGYYTYKEGETSYTIRNDIGVTSSGMFFMGASSTSITTNVTADTNRHTFMVDATTGEWSIDGVGGSVAPASHSDYDVNVLIGARSGRKASGAIVDSTYYCEEKIYDVRIYTSGILARAFVPCYRKSDDKPGLYDMMSNTFYTNDGTGEFTLGPDV